MSIPVPLGVRIYQVATGLDQWVTRWVDDISFRSVIPGGFASANITLHNEGSDSWSRLAKLYNRVQICDLRTQEIAWEGRVDTARRQSDSDTWELGCLGAMVAASDIKRPMFYIDSSVDSESWMPWDGNDYISSTSNEPSKSIQIEPSAEVWFGRNGSFLTWQRAQSTDLYIGRFDIGYTGQGSHASLGSFRTAVTVTELGDTNPQDNVDLTAWNSALIRKTNRIGTDFTSLVAQHLQVYLDMGSATVTTKAGEVYGQIVQPRVQVQRMDRNGVRLTTAADYPNDYLTVPQIIEDVVGRFLVGGWDPPDDGTPYPGQVRPDDIYIDTSSTAQITHLAYWDGATAADILGDLMVAQPNVYWALWESDYGTEPGSQAPGFRFEWATWPGNWGYLATSIDGLEEQPDGAGIYNYLFYQHADNVTWGFTSGLGRVQNYWDGNNNQLLADAQLARATTVKAEEPQISSVAFNRAAGIISTEMNRTVNTGTLTVKRPIYLYDAGSNGNSGASRMLDPWMVKPGKLIRITDLPPRGMSNDLRPQPSTPNPALDGTVFRVVGTTYNSSDNSCVLELDQPPAWALSTQIADGGGSGNLVVRG